MIVYGDTKLESPFYCFLLTADLAVLFITVSLRLGFELDLFSSEELPSVFWFVALPYE